MFLTLAIGIFIGASGMIVIALILETSSIKLKGCKNCKHLWDDCVGQECGYCEKWEVRQ